MGSEYRHATVTAQRVLILAYLHFDNSGFECVKVVTETPNLLSRRAFCPVMIRMIRLGCAADLSVLFGLRIVGERSSMS